MPQILISKLHAVRAKSNDVRHSSLYCTPPKIYKKTTLKNI